MSKWGALFFRYVFETGDEKRLKKMKQDLSDLHIRRDIAYLPDAGEERGHLLDIYEQKGADGPLPVMVNIHGGGLFASYKEVNANFNYEWARRGYRTVSISYRRIPEVTLKEQIDDVMAALRFIAAHKKELWLKSDRFYLTGDSAGALLALYALSLNGGAALRRAFHQEETGLSFQAAGFISIFLDTQRDDLMKCVSDRVLADDAKDEPFAEYILDPVRMLDQADYPPLYLLTGAQDAIRKDTMKLAAALDARGMAYQLKDFPKGKERALDHVFAVKFPKWPESREAFDGMIRYFKEAKQDEKEG